VPVGRCCDVNDIDIGVVDEVTIEVVTSHILVQTLLCSVDTSFEVVAIDITHSHETTLLVARKMEAAHTDTSGTDDTLGQLVVRRNVTGTSEYAARNDSQRSQTTQRF
jgi:hypothetical protein